MMKKSAIILKEKRIMMLDREIIVRLIETDYSGGKRIIKPSASFSIPNHDLRELIAENKRLKKLLKSKK